MRLNLGCGRDVRPGYVNVDIDNSHAPDKIKKHDLSDPLPFEDNSADFILARHVLEHITNGDDFLKEIQRVLKPHASAEITVPYAGELWQHPNVWKDPQHKRPWTVAAFQHAESYGFQIACIRFKKERYDISPFAGVRFLWILRFPIMRRVETIVTLTKV